MTWPTVSPSDVEGLWRPLKPSETTVATTRIKLVEAELRKELRLHGIVGTPVVGDLGIDSADAVEEWETLYTGIVAEVVRQSLLNPEGWLEERESIDDYERSRRRDASTSTGLAYLTEADVEKLLPREPRPKRGAFSIRLGQT